MVLDRKEPETIEMDLDELKEYLQEHPDEILRITLGEGSDERSQNQTGVE